MATVAHLVEILSKRLDEPVAVVRQKLRQLQNDGLLPVASGRAVPDVEPHHVAAAMFAVLASPNVKESTRTVNAYWELEPNGFSRDAIPQAIFDKMQLGDPGTAGAFLAALLDQAFDYVNGKEVEDATLPYSTNAGFDFVTSWPELHARVPLTGGDVWEVRFLQSGSLPDHWQGYVRRSANVSGRAIHDIARDLVRAADE